MTPSEAITAYTKLAEAMPTRQAKTDEEVTANDDKFRACFIQTLIDAGLSVDVPLQDDTLSCQT